MPPVHFTVSQIRTAAACPRILYFDAHHTRVHDLKQPTVTRIWKEGGDETTACGSLFHAAIEQLNSRAAADPVVAQLLSEATDAADLAQKLHQHVYWQNVNRETLFQKSGPQQQAFTAALRRYVGELSDILIHARNLGKPRPEILQEMFGDRRRRVDVTFDLDAGDPVRVTGILDYVFYDWRTENNRIIDYKLTPASTPTNDLFQVCVYALMHHAQHQSQPDAAVLYLHPKREMIEKKWDQLFAEQQVVMKLLASMRDWVRYDESTGAGLRPRGEPIYCGACRWRDVCEPRLGPKNVGGQVASLDSRTEHGQPVPPSTATSEPRASTSGSADTSTLWLGATPDASLVQFPLATLATHVSVVGAAGSGKTWLAKVIAEEAICQGVPVIAVDPQGDLVQFLRRRDAGELSSAERERYDRYWDRVEPRILTPGTSHGIRLSLNPIRLPNVEELAAIPDEQRREEELENFLRTVAGCLVGLAKAGGDTDCQLAFLFQVLRRLTSERRDARGSFSLNDVAAAASEPRTVGLDEPDRFIKKGDREKLARKLHNLLFGATANLFSGGESLDIEALLRPTQPGKTPLNVVYLNALTDDDQKQFFVAVLATELYRWMVGAGSTGQVQTLFYLDEARDYLPAGARKPPAKEPLLRLFSQGRKFGVACLMCTQSPRSVDYNVFSNCSTKLIGRLESAQDLERVEQWFQDEGPSPQWLRGRVGADAGSFLGRWPNIPAAVDGQSWKSRVLYSAHEGAWSADRVESEWRDYVDSVR